MEIDNKDDEDVDFVIPNVAIVVVVVVVDVVVNVDVVVVCSSTNT